jgi:hypothetical protein
LTHGAHDEHTAGTLRLFSLPRWLAITFSCQSQKTCLTHSHHGSNSGRWDHWIWLSLFLQHGEGILFPIRVWSAKGILTSSAVMPPSHDVELAVTSMTRVSVCKARL